MTTDLSDFQFNTQIAAMIELANELMRLRETDLPATPEWRFAVESLVSLLAPSAPHRAEEMWEQLGKPYSIHTQPWPQWDDALTVDANVEIVVQVNGKPRDRVLVSAGSAQETVESQALVSDKVMAHLQGRSPKKIIFVPDRLINFVG